jgi:hypothetical protein
MATDLEFVSITENDLAGVAQFLRSIFGAADDWVPFRPDVIRWKSLQPHSLWEGSRGYVLRHQGKIVAHGCVMPARFLRENSVVTSACIIDWTADKSFAGSGVMIYQKIGRLTETLIGVGGSDDAQKVLPRLGFQPRQDFLTYTKVTKPAAAYVETKDTSARGLARFARDVTRSLKPVNASAKGWSIRLVKQFDESIAGVLPRPGAVSETVCYRDAGFLNYFLDCPAARMQGIVFENDGKLAGYAILAFVRGEGRISELWISSKSEKDWAAAYVLATEAAAAASGVTRVVLGCSAQLAQRAALKAGAYLYGRQPIYVKDPKALLPELDVALGMLDTDAFYL